MAYLNGKRIAYVILKNGTRYQDVQYEFMIYPSDDKPSEDSKTWIRSSAVRYYVKIEPDEFPNISSPFIAHAVRYDKDGKIEQTILESRRLVDDTLYVYSNEPIICKIILKGEGQ